MREQVDFLATNLIYIYLYKINLVLLSTHTHQTEKMASPWKKITPLEPQNFQDIMSAEYAEKLQDRENKKFEEILKQYVIPNIYGEVEGETMHRSGTESPPQCGGEFLEFIQHDNEIMCPENQCDSDRLLAELLQSEYNREHDEQVKRIEKQTNKDSKVAVSFSKYRMNPVGLDDDDSDDYDDYDDERKKKDWDRFEANEKMFRGINRKGFTHDEDGVIITKHDARLNGVRNACRVMSFPPEFETGDAAGFDMELSNAVFNQLKSYSQKAKKNKAYDRRDNTATAEMGIDEPTRLRLYKLINNQVLQEINGIISTGKEAVILHAKSDPNYPGEQKLPKEIAIKVFKTTLNEFKTRDRYIKDDFRFKDRFSKQNNRTVIKMWAEKEMHNLKRIKSVGINCPSVIALKNNILLMSFIGDVNGPARKLKYALLAPSEMTAAYHEVCDIIKKLYTEAKLVHADLSEYNILWLDGKVYLIDVAQAVEPRHPSALEFLLRDITNMMTFFKRAGVENVCDPKEFFRQITGYDAHEHTAAMLERMHFKGATVTVATQPSIDGMPDELKPLTYPFDYVWKKNEELKAINPTETVECIVAAANWNDHPIHHYINDYENMILLTHF